MGQYSNFLGKSSKTSALRWFCGILTCLVLYPFSANAQVRDLNPLQDNPYLSGKLIAPKRWATTDSVLVVPPTWFGAPGPIPANGDEIYQGLLDTLRISFPINVLPGPDRENGFRGVSTRSSNWALQSAARYNAEGVIIPHVRSTVLTPAGSASDIDLDLLNTSDGSLIWQGSVHVLGRRAQATVCTERREFSFKSLFHCTCCSGFTKVTADELNLH